MENLPDVQWVKEIYKFTYFVLLDFTTELKSTYTSKKLTTCIHDELYLNMVFHWCIEYREDGSSNIRELILSQGMGELGQLPRKGKMSC